MPSLADFTDDAAVRHAVILAGGSGTRLWPASRRDRAKQFLRLGGDESLLTATARRLSTVAPQVTVVTAKSQAAEVRRHVPTAAVLAEPCARNTAIAIGWAAAHLAATDPDAILGVFPADHHIGDEAAFAATVLAAFAAVEAADVIVTIGVVPSRAETGYGYLELGEPSALATGARAVRRFVEKPAAAIAETYLAGGQHWWNAGMFFFRASRMARELTRCAPDVATALATVMANAGNPAAMAQAYAQAPSISIDHAVMEHQRDLICLPGEFAWNDIGAWPSVPGPVDASGNVTLAPTIAVDAHRNLCVSDHGIIALVGVSDLVVVRDGDAVLVMHKDRAQDVRQVVAALAAHGKDDLA